MKSAAETVLAGVYAKLNGLGTLGSVCVDPKQGQGDRYTVVDNPVELPGTTKNTDHTEVIITAMSWATTLLQAQQDRGRVVEALSTRIRADYITVAAGFFVTSQQYDAGLGIDANTRSVKDEQTGLAFYGAPARVRFLIQQL